jgi:hypothetical protein
MQKLASLIVTLIAFALACSGPETRFGYQEGLEPCFPSGGAADAGSEQGGSSGSAGSEQGGSSGSAGSEQGGSSGSAGSEQGGSSGSAGSEQGGSSGSAGSEQGGSSGSAGSEQGGSSGSAGSEQGGAGGMAGAPPEKAYILILNGQSNAVGASTDSRPAGLPDASIPMWRQDYYYNDGPHAFVPMNVYPRNNTFGQEIALARALQAAGKTVAVIKLVRGATYITRWLPTMYVGQVFYPELAEAWAAAHVLFPGKQLVPLWTWDQGQEEGVYTHTNQAAALAVVKAWSDNFAIVRSNVQATIGHTSPYVIQTSRNMTGHTFPWVIEDEQASVVDVPSHLIPTDDLALKSDGKHYTGAAQNTLGARTAAVILTDIAAGL